MRIIAGHWRGRKLHFPKGAQIRPTLNRVRETMFAWCQDVLPGAHCLDLFAGSGAMGFEALSRGAASVVMVDRDRMVVKSLQENCKILSTDCASIVQAEVPCQKHLLGVKPFDLVFLDPPFGGQMYENIFEWLEAQGLLINGAEILCEWGLHQKPKFPIIVDLLRQARAGQVGYGLLKYNQERK